MIIRKAKYKVNSRFDGYWYVVFTEVDDNIKDKLDVRCVEKYDYWVIADDEYGDVAGSFCWEHWVNRIDNDMIKKLLE